MNKNILNFMIRSVRDSGAVRSVYADDATAGMYAKQLVTQTIGELFRHEFPELKWMNAGLIPFMTSIDEGAKEYSFIEMENAGEAEIIADNADDLPEVDIAGKNNLREIVTVGCSVSYSMQDIRTSKFQGMFDIASEKSAAAREASDRRLDQLIRTGAPAKGLRGVCNQEGCIVFPATFGTWSSATAANIIADFTAAVSAMMVETNGVENPNAALFPLEVWTRVSTLPFDSTSGAMTVLEFLKKAFPMITRWDYDVGLSTSSPSGGAMVLIYRIDPSRMRAVFPMMMRPLAPEQRGLKIKLGFESRFGGVMTPRPKSVMYLTGI
jgi:hypothetical protein